MQCPRPFWRSKSSGDLFRAIPVHNEGHRSQKVTAKQFARRCRIVLSFAQSCGKAHFIQDMWDRRVNKFFTFAGLLLVMNSPQPVAASPAAGLEGGFSRLYDLDFSGAQKEFESWEKLHTEDPMGPAAEAAGILFAEFNRLGVLESQFYVDDSVFAARKKYEADPQKRARFEELLNHAEEMGKSKLSKDPRDQDALLAMTLSAGLRSDFAALIEKRNLASLHYTKEATAWSQQLLAVDPNCYDAHLAGGVSRYVIGSMAAPVRWILRLGGVSGDKAGGIAELQTTAEKGYLLAPFARILLSIAYVRDRDLPQARILLQGLQRDFPDNTLFARELSRLDVPAAR